MGRQMAVTEGVKGDEFEVRGFHNPLFSSTVGAPKDKSLYPSVEPPAAAAKDDKDDSIKSSSMVMRRHGRKDGRKDGTLVGATRQRPDRQKRAASERQLRRVSSLDVPSCVVVRRGDASDTEGILQHCAFHMETFRVHTKSSSPKAAAAGGGPPSVTFLFVFHGGGPNQVALEITHKPRPASAGAEATAGSPAGGGRDETILGRLPPSPSSGEGRVTMTLGGASVPHLPGEPYSCYIHQVGNVTFNPRKQAKGRYLYILSQEGRTLFTALS